MDYRHKPTQRRGPDWAPIGVPIRGRLTAFLPIPTDDRRPARCRCPAKRAMTRTMPAVGGIVGISRFIRSTRWSDGSVASSGFGEPLAGSARRHPRQLRRRDERCGDPLRMVWLWRDQRAIRWVPDARSSRPWCWPIVARSFRRLARICRVSAKLVDGSDEISTWASSSSRARVRHELMCLSVERIQHADSRCAARDRVCQENLFLNAKLVACAHVHLDNGVFCHHQSATPSRNPRRQLHYNPDLVLGRDGPKLLWPLTLAPGSWRI